MGIVRWESSKITGASTPPTSWISTCAPVAAGSKSAGVPFGTITEPWKRSTSSPDGATTCFTVSTEDVIGTPSTQTAAGNVVDVVVAPTSVVVVLVVAPG